jgi:exodeoxyribonuclease VII small subunit
MMDEKQSIEGIFKRLDELTVSLEAPGTTLDESLKLYKQAVEIITAAKEKLQSVQAEVDRLSETEEA